MAEPTDNTITNFLVNALRFFLTDLRILFVLLVSGLLTEIWMVVIYDNIIAFTHACCLGLYLLLWTGIFVLHCCNYPFWLPGLCWRWSAQDNIPYAEGQDSTTEEYNPFDLSDDYIRQATAEFPQLQATSLSLGHIRHLLNFMTMLHVALKYSQSRLDRVTCFQFCQMYVQTLPLPNRVTYKGLKVVMELLSGRLTRKYQYFEPTVMEKFVAWCGFRFTVSPEVADLGGDDFPDSPVFQSLDDAREKIGNLRDAWKEVHSSDLVLKIRQVIGYLVGFIYTWYNPSERKYTPDFFVKLGVDCSPCGPATLFDCVLSTTQLLLEKLKTFSESGDIRDLYRRNDSLRALESTLADIDGNLAALELGNYDLTPFRDSHDVLFKVDEAIGELRSMHSSEKNKIQRLWLTSKLAKAQDMRIRLLKSSTADRLRMEPFGVLIYGLSSIGKSTLSNQLMKLLLECNGFSSQGHNVTVLNLNDKYQSDYRPQHAGIVLDDIANTKANKSDVNHAQLIIDIINNTPKAALQAEAEKKGLVMFRPSVVIGTTNVKDLQAGLWSNEPFSVARRFPYTLTVTVLKDHRKEGGHQLNPVTVPPGVADVWNIKVQIPMPNQRGHHYMTVVEGKFSEIAPYLVARSRDHFEHQKRVVTTAHDVYNRDVCEHDSYAAICPYCANEFQSRGFAEKYALIRLYLVLLTLEPMSTLVYNLYMWAMAKGFLTTTNAPFVMFFFYFCLIYILGKIGILLGGIMMAQGFLYYNAHLAGQQAHSWLSNVMVASMGWRHWWRRNRRRITFFGIGLVTCLTLLSVLKNYKAAFQSVSEGRAPEPDTKLRENVWSKVRRVPIPCSPKSRTMAFQDLFRLIQRDVRVAELDTGEHTHLFPVKGDMWVMNAHVWDGRDHVSMCLVRGDVSSNANVWEHTITQDRVHLQPNSDLAFVRLPGAGSVKDYSHYFPTNYNKEAFSRLNGRLAHRDVRGGSCTIDFHHSQPRPTYLVGSSLFPRAVVATFNSATFNGLCGAPWVVDCATPVILGIHFAGHAGRPVGACHSITQQDIQVAAAILEDKSINMTLMSSGDFNSTSCGVEYGPFVDNHMKSPMNFLSDFARIDNYGAHALPRRTFRSAVKPSLIADGVTEIFGVEPTHGPPQQMNHWRHMQRHAEAISHTNDEINPVFLRMAKDDLSAKVRDICTDKAEALKRVAPLDESTTLSGSLGVWGVDRLNQSTSAGWPLNEPKKRWIESISPATSTSNEVLKLHPIIRDEVTRIEESAIAGERSYMVFRANIKDEPTRLGKDKLRVFAGAPLAHSFLIRKYFLMAVVFIQSFPIPFECAVGVDAHGPDWTKLMRHVRSKGTHRGVAGDYSAYDTRICVTILLTAYKILFEILQAANVVNGRFTPDDFKIIRALITDLVQPVYEHNGDIIGAVGSNPSGHNLTVIVNNIANSLYMRYSYFALGSIRNIVDIPPFHDMISLLCYGDDNMMTVDLLCTWFNHTDVAEILGSIGVVYTMADKESESVPFICLDDATFLKRGALWDDEMGAFLAPLEAKSIFKSLHNRLVMKGSCSAREHAGSVISAACTEFFHHGRAVYEDALPKLQQLVDMYDLSNQVSELVSYEDKRLAYMEKYY